MCTYRIQPLLGASGVDLASLLHVLQYISMISKMKRYRAEYTRATGTDPFVLNSVQ